MRKLIIHFTIALFNFGVGLSVSSSTQKSNLKSENIREIPELIEATTFETEMICEIHSLSLEETLVQRICGEFNGSIKKGRSGQLKEPCPNSKKTNMLAEDAQFFFNMVGGENTWAWWKDFESTKKAQFPHGYDWIYTECKMNGISCHKIKACTKCRAAEISWKRNSLH